ncbi:hypothetical protein AC249_AIPGENE19458 [Exaiptasia diaphana]|nr:hypothetical protein AC249_AIPGENE19458 [Exaiptasia diaphana]
MCWTGLFVSTPKAKEASESKLNSRARHTRASAILNIKMFEYEDHVLVEQQAEKIQREYFERGDAEDQAIDLDSLCMLLISDHQDHITLPCPSSYKVQNLLNAMRVPEEVAISSVGSAKKKNDIISTITQSDEIHSLGMIFWDQCCRMIFKDVTAAIENHTHISITPVHSAIGAELMEETYKCILASAAEKVEKNKVVEPVNFNVRDMPPEGLAKVRPPTCQRSQASADSLHTSSLNVTEEKQYRNRALLHIEDKVFEFFLDLEGTMVEYVNEQRLMQFKEHIIDNALTSMKDSKKLKDKWLECFPYKIGVSNKGAILKIFKMVVEKYVHMGADQFLRDFRRAHRIKRTAEHRKKVLERQKPREVKTAVCTIDDMKADTSPGKVTSHHKIINFVEKFGEAEFVKAYKRTELVTLSKAYGVSTNGGWWIQHQDQQNPAST